MSADEFQWFHGVCRDCGEFEDIFRSEDRAAAATAKHADVDDHRAVYGGIA